MARYAMRNPWWTLSNFEGMQKATGLQGDAKQVHWQLSEAATAASTAQVTGFNYKEPKTEQEVRCAENVVLLHAAFSVVAVRALVFVLCYGPNVLSVHL